jgi:MFS family permease
MYAAFIVGYSLSPLTINLFGNNGPYIAAAVLWAGASLLDLLLPTLRSTRHQTVKLVGTARVVWREIHENLREVWSRHTLYFPLILLAIAQAVVGIILALAPALSLAVLKTPLTNAAHILIIPAGLGLVFGVIAVGWLIQRWSAAGLAAVAFVLGSVGLVLMGLSGQLYRAVDGHQIATHAQVSVVVALLAFGLGLMNAIISTSAQTLLQQGSTDETRGKVFSVLNVLVNVSATIPVFLAGVLADVFSVTKVLAALGVAMFIVGIAQLWRLRRLTASQRG